MFKIELEFSDLFVSSIDISGLVICYSVRDKETGKMIEEKHTSKMEEFEGKFYFDNRFINVAFAHEIQKQLL
ncbi:hypothetical protein LCGC14_1810570 [marine sediment metagenome]|uniref:Uncharacterized protein n=1 Tax=marine sediment metagenome TaxID=412755 RepID=A0A0F9GLS5_9ZZZZ